MGALDDLAAALRARTKTRVYGTPYADETLAKLQQGLTAGDLANQQAQFNLGESQTKAEEEAPLRPLMQQAKIDELKGKGAKAQADAELSSKKAAGYDDAQSAINEWTRARAAASGAKSETDKIKAQADVTRAEAALHRALGGGQSKPPSYNFKDGTYNGEEGLYAFNPKDPGAPPIRAGQGPVSTPTASGAPAPASGGGFRSKPNAQVVNRQDQAEKILVAAPSIIKALNDPEIQSGLGFIMGNANRGLDAIGTAPPNIRALRTQLHSLASLLPILHAFKGGIALASKFESMVGDINQGPEQIKASVGAIAHLAKLIRSGTDDATVEAAIAQIDQGLGGGTGGATPKPASKIGRFSVQVE